MSKLIVFFGFLYFVMSFFICCKAKKQEVSGVRSEAKNDEVSKEEDAEKVTALFMAHGSILKNFEFESNDMYEMKQALPDGVVMIPYSESVPDVFKMFKHENNMLYLVYDRALLESAGKMQLARGPKFAPKVKFNPPVKKIPDFEAKYKKNNVDPEFKKNMHKLLGSSEFGIALKRVNDRMDFYKKTGIKEIEDPSDIVRAQHFTELIDDVKSKYHESELDEIYSEVNWRIENTGVLAPNGLVSFLNGKNSVSLKQVYDANFSKLTQYVNNKAINPKEFWELNRRWPWPSDHLPAISAVRIKTAGSDLELKVGTMNLLKKGFDDNRLQTSQGLGGQLASRYLQPLEKNIRVDTTPAIKPSDAKGQATIPETKVPRAGWKNYDAVSKDWQHAELRNKAQNDFIDKQINEGKIDLLGLNEVSTKHKGDLEVIAQNRGYALIGTKSARDARDTITGVKDPELLDHGVILVNIKKYDILDNPLVSSYIDPKTNRPNKHITSVLLKDKVSGQRFVFTNTHADFGEISSLGKHHQAVVAKYGDDVQHIIVGDMNASSSGVKKALSDFAGGKEVRYSNNTPAHVGFSKGHEGQVVDYDQVFVVGNKGGSEVKESSDIGEWHRDYASAYEAEFSKLLP